MTRIGLLSDTHAYWDEKYLEYFEPCDEIWHAGDIGSLELADAIAARNPTAAHDAMYLHLVYNRNMIAEGAQEQSK